MGVAAAVAVLGTVSVVLFAQLPDPVPVYYTPATEPDVEYPKVIYLVQWIVLLGLGAFFIGRVVTALAEAFTSERRNRPANLARSAGEWCAVWFIVSTSGVLLVDLVSLDGTTGWMFVRLVGVLLAIVGIPVVAWAAARKRGRPVTQRRN